MLPHDPKPWIGLTLGDPAGVGPELVLRAFRQPRVREAANLVLIGPGELLPAELERCSEASLARPSGSGHALALEVPGEVASWTPGQDQASSGRAALEALRVGHELALQGKVDALVTAPVSKRALHLAGEPCEGQTELLGRWCGATRFQMTVRHEGLTVMLLTRHLPLARALEEIRAERVLDHLLLLDETLRRSGIRRPLLALAGLNPHAGERGLLGREELEELVPALESARRIGVRVDGPLSPDALFMPAVRSRFDGILALYHDQAFIPMKLLARDRGVTILAGLPYLRVSPIHGTAYDLVGTGRASEANLVEALAQAAELAPEWSTRRTLDSVGG